MDINEFEIPENDINPDFIYGQEIEFLVKELNNIAHMAGRYSRSVQLKSAFFILNKMKKMLCQDKKELPVFEIKFKAKILDDNEEVEFSFSEIIVDDNDHENGIIYISGKAGLSVPCDMDSIKVVLP